MKCVNDLYNFIPDHSSLATNFKQYGSYRTVEPFDLPMQNTIFIHIYTHIYVTGFAKRGLMHASNFSTLKICNLALVQPMALKFGM